MANRAGRRDKNQGYRQVDPVRSPRSAFDLSYAHKTTAEPSVLLPVYSQEVIPGDTISCTPKVFVRQLSSIFPVMDGLRAEMQFFFVPYRIVWDNWSKLQGERVNPGDHVDYEVPTITAGAGGFAKHSSFDYLGAPTEIAGIEISALPNRAAALCWNEWFRDENLQDSLVIPTGDGPDSPTDAAFALHPRGKPKDRFGGALPYAQKGDPVSLPLGSTAPVDSDGTTPTFRQVGWTNPENFQSFGAQGFQAGTAWDSGTATNLLFVNSGLEVDLSSATASTINVIREAVALQQLFERDARSSNRYADGIYSAFGVVMPDARYRPVLISTGTVDIQSIEIPNYNPTTFVAPEVIYQGRPAAMVKGAGQLRSWSYSVDEWGIILGFLTIRSEISYSQGIPAHLLRRTRIDHYVPELALLGEEAIFSAEIYADGTGSRADQTGDFQPWGFTPRYESYRHRVNQVSGELRSYNVTTGTEFGRLDRFHYGLDFGSRPVLDAAFIEDDPNPINRNTLHSVAPPFVVDMQFQQRGVRPIPKTARPGLLRF